MYRPPLSLAEAQRRCRENTAFMQQVRLGAFTRHYRPDGTYDLIDTRGRTPAQAQLEQQIAGEEATIRVYRQRVRDCRRAWKAWKRSDPAACNQAHLGDARYALLMWRRHRAELKRLQRELAGLVTPVLAAAE